MKNKLVWRLGKLPSTEELRELVKDKIITQEEAREILFSSETEEDRDKKSLELEIKFLKEIITKLSETKNQIVEVIKYVEKPYYYNQPWYGSTVTYLCGSLNDATTSGGTDNNLIG